MRDHKEKRRDLERMTLQLESSLHIISVCPACEEAIEPCIDREAWQCTQCRRVWGLTLIPGGEGYIAKEIVF